MSWSGGHFEAVCLELHEASLVFSVLLHRSAAFLQEPAGFKLAVVFLSCSDHFCCQD